MSMVAALAFNGELRFGDLISGIGLLAAACSLVFAGYQLRLNRRTSRMQFLLDITDRYFGDAELRAFYYQLDYNQWRFDPDTLPLSPEEPHLDHLIYTFDLIEQLIGRGALSEDEVSILGFQALRVLNNPEVERYLEWLDGEYERCGRSTPAHAGARKLAARFSRVTAARPR